MFVSVLSRRPQQRGRMNYNVEVYATSGLLEPAFWYIRGISAAQRLK
jgi:hypothetical protein